MKQSQFTKCLFVLIFVVSVLGYGNVGLATEYPTATVMIDDQEIQEQKGIVDGGSIFVPAKAVFENLGIRVEWEQSTSTLKGYQFDSLRIEVSPNKDVGKLDGKPFLLDHPPKVINGTLMVPSTLITQLFSYGVEFEPISNVIKINKDQIVVVDPYASYNKKIEQEKAKKLVGVVNNQLNNQNDEKFIQFKKELANNMGKTNWIIGSKSVKNAKGEAVLLDSLTPIFILDIQRKNDWTYELKIKSGDNIYYWEENNAYYITRQIINYNPYIEHKNWSKKTWDAVKSGELYIGIPWAAIMYSYGLPDKTNEYVNEQGKMEQWIYANGKLYLYIQNGKLIAIQNFL
jgi:Copper amine oxidase N-terminal domain